MLDGKGWEGLISEKGFYTKLIKSFVVLELVCYLDISIYLPTY